jgi:hypothetical protein
MVGTGIELHDPWSVNDSGGKIKHLKPLNMYFPEHIR